MERGHGIPKEREEDKRREVCEWEGCVCVHEAIGASSMLRLVRRAGWPWRGCCHLRFELGVKQSTEQRGRTFQLTLNVKSSKKNWLEAPIAPSVFLSVSLSLCQLCICLSPSL